MNLYTLKIQFKNCIDRYFFMGRWKKRVYEIRILAPLSGVAPGWYVRKYDCLTLHSVFAFSSFLYACYRGYVNSGSGEKVRIKRLKDGGGF